MTGALRVLCGVAVGVAVAGAVAVLRRESAARLADRVIREVEQQIRHGGRLRQAVKEA